MVLEHTPSPSPGGYFDFNPTFPAGTGALPAPATRQRPFPETRIAPEPIDLLDFLPSCQRSEGMREFSLPLNAQLNETRNLALQVMDLGNYETCPLRFLPHLAANHGFELIDVSYATERELRRLCRDAFTIIKRRCSLWSVRRIIEDLGFTVQLDAEYQISGRFNKHKFWSRMAATSKELTFSWDQASLDGWTNESLGNFKAIASSLRGSSNSGAASPTMSATYPETTSDYNLQFDYRLLTSGDCFFGAIGRWESALKVLLVTFSKSGATEALTVYVYTGSWLPLQTVDISAIDWKSGTHRVTIWDSGSTVTVFLDDTVLMYQVNYAALVTAVKKGLFCAAGTEVEFDNYVLRVMDRRKLPKFYDPAQADKSLKITLSGGPAFETAKREYLEKIIPQFVPIDTEVQWL